MPVLKPLTRVAAAIVVAGVASALALSPLAGVSAVAISRTHNAMETNLADITDGQAPGVTTVLDNAGEPMAWLYKQRRVDVPSNRIADSMKQAIVSVEDRRFYEHEGVDWTGTLRAFATNLVSGGVQQGASTINQQYVKNYLLLVEADDSAEQQAATERSIPRKLREMRMASEINNELPKDEILARYLNVVPFGNGAYGIESAAQTYFGVPAKDLSVTQSALLAGMVQSSSALNPYKNPAGATERRNTVLDTMVQAGHLSPEEAEAHKAEPLGVLPEPKGLPNGCIAAGDRGFFCDYVLNYLASKGLDQEKLTRGSYTIHTTLDPKVQDSAQKAVASNVDPKAPGVAEVMNVIAPGRDSRDIKAVVSSRTYGLNGDANETVLPQPTSMVGAGAGSVFKVFTAAAAIQKGMGIDQMLAVPPRVELPGLGSGGAKNCPPGLYCVENVGPYKSQMTLREALAHSPNTAFVNLIAKVGVPDTVDMAVKLGLRSYAEKGTQDEDTSIADYMKKMNLGSFTLGPTSVNALELSNVGASIASDGRWCEPSPVAKVTDSKGQDVPIERPKCEQVLDPTAAHSLMHALSDDVVSGTAKNASHGTNWRTPMSAKTGTTETYQSAAFLGFNSGYAAAPYIFNDGNSLAPLCTSPVRQCPEGNLYGGTEPAKSWFAAANPVPQATGGALPPFDPRFSQGTARSDIPQVDGLEEADARNRLTAAGYKVETAFAPGNGVPRNRAIGVDASQVVMKGDTVTLLLSDGSAKPTPPPPPIEIGPLPGYPPGPGRPGPRPRPAPAPVVPPPDLNDAIGDLLDQILPH